LIVLTNFIIQVTHVGCLQLQEKNLEKRWEKMKKFTHLSSQVTSDIGILYFDRISKIAIMMTFLMRLS
jgi:hypothetical protein